MNAMPPIAGGFGPDVFVPGLFYRFSSALRFELAADPVAAGNHIPSFLQAFERSRRVIAAAVGHGPVTVVLACHDYVPPKGRRRMTRDVEAAGLNPSAFEPVTVAELSSPLGARRHWLRASNVPEADRNKLIWCAAATDLPIRPRIRDTNIYIVAEEARIIAHVYDDRGMDIVSSERSALREIYRQFEDWLLPHDIEKMTTTFGAD